ncbi:MAG: hypothetical protein K0S27_735 [Gammaproteobacteria bacterium]|jgi:hypothetical protein|nr:hypothetical protein [Gammaproteobacteria bacterium]
MFIIILILFALNGSRNQYAASQAKQAAATKAKKHRLQQAKMQL